MYKPIHHQRLKTCNLVIIVTDLLLISIIFALLWVTQADSVSYVVTIVISLVILACMVIYYTQVFSEDKRISPTWNRQVEYAPLFFCVLRWVLAFFIFSVVLLNANEISVFQAISNLHISTLSLVLIGFSVLLISTIAVTCIVFVHRTSSVIYQQREKKIHHHHHQQHQYIGSQQQHPSPQTLSAHSIASTSLNSSSSNHINNNNNTTSEVLYFGSLRSTPDYPPIQQQYNNNSGSSSSSRNFEESDPDAW